MENRIFSPLDHVPTTTIITISSNILLYTTKYHNPVLIKYEIECNLPYELYFELNFHDSQNIQIINYENNVITDKKMLVGKISPYTKFYLGEIRIEDVTYRSVLKTKYNWKKVGFNVQTISELAKRDKNFRQAEIENMKRLILPSNRNRPEATIELYSHHGIRYIDTVFLPDLSFDYISDITAENNQPKKYAITWRRASEIFENNLCIFPPSMDLSPLIICQGPLSNSIVLESIYALCERPTLLQNLFTSNNSHFNQCGMYQICLCLNGSWKFLSLDEYLPCFPTPDSTGGLVCSKTHHQSAIWLPLLEKGICKHYLTYSLHETPLTHEDVLLMCTGSPVSRFGDMTKVLKDNPLYKTNTLKNKHWNHLVDHLDRNHLIICQTIQHLTKIDKNNQQIHLTSDKGLLFEQTSYTLLRLIETSSQEFIMQFRYPFNVPDFEWIGDWSDRSTKWSSQIEFEIGIDNRTQTNTFWISFEDYLQYFTGGIICLLCTEEINNREWSELRTRSWFQLKEKLDTAPTTSSPSSLSPPSPSSPPSSSTDPYPTLSNMYILKISNEPTEIHFTIHQLLTPSYYLFDIGLAILRVTPDYSFELVATTGIAVSQQLATSVILSPDVYLLVPVTTGARLLEYKTRNQFHSTNLQSIGLFDHQNKKFTDKVEDAFSEIFDRLDNDMDDVLTRDELEIYLKTKEGNDLQLQDSIYQWLMSNFDSFDGGLTRLGYKQTQLYMFKCSGDDEQAIWNDLIQMGYDYQLQLNTAFTTVLTLHSESENLSIRQQRVDKSGYLEAIELIIKQRSTNVIEYDEGMIRVYEYQNSIGFSLGIENYSSQIRTIEVKFSQRTAEIISHRGSLETIDTIPSGKFHLIQHVFVAHHNHMKKEIRWDYEINIT